MTVIKDREYSGERPLYASHDVRLENVTIGDGESGIKECTGIEAVDSTFKGMYVLWETAGIRLENCRFTETSRASLWYSRDCVMKGCESVAPKMFRRMNGLTVEDTVCRKAQEYLWDCKNVTMRNVMISECEYVFMRSENIRLDNCVITGGYGFQYTKNVECHNCVINSKDAFWEAENITLVDCEVNGKYLAWYVKDMKLVRCHITGEQQLCYADGLTLEDCTFGDDADLLFEYSTVNGTIKGDVVSIKNPTSGTVEIEGSLGELIMDENVRQPADAMVIVKGKE